MKLLLIAIFTMTLPLKLLAQNGHGCCPSLLKPSEYLPVDTVVTSCLLCSNFETQKKDELIEPLVSNDADEQSAYDHEKSLDKLGDQQRVIIKNITKLIQLTNEKFGGEVKSLDEVLDKWSPLVILHMTDQINSQKLNGDNAKSDAKNCKLNHKDNILGEKKLHKNLEEYLSTTAKLYNFFNAAITSFKHVGFKASEKDLEVLKKLESLHFIKASLTQKNED